MKFTNAKLEQAFIELIENVGYLYFASNCLARPSKDEVLTERNEIT